MGLEVRHSEALPLPLREALGVREMEGEPLPVRDTLGDSLEEKVTEELRQWLSVGEFVKEAEGQLLTVLVTLSVGVTEDDRHSEGVELTVCVTLGEALGEKVTEDVRQWLSVAEEL